MKLQQVKDFFDAGVITAFSLHRAPMGEGWLLCLHGKAPSYLQTALGGDRVFSSVETVLNLIKTITGQEVQSVRFVF